VGWGVGRGWDVGEEAGAEGGGVYVPGGGGVGVGGGGVVEGGHLAVGRVSETRRRLTVECYDGVVAVRAPGKRRQGWDH
jgi:hypothetical protein